MSEQPGQQTGTVPETVSGSSMPAGGATVPAASADLLPRWLRPARAWVHRRPAGVLLWKIAVSVVGGLIVLIGLALIPLPGPGWAVVFLGLAVWATEFAWANRLLMWAKRLLREWTDWAKRQSLFVRGLIGLAGLVLLAGLAYLGWRYLR